jgi:hypothetical protein
MSFATEGEYKGKPLLVLKASDEDGAPFQFGVRKAKLLLAHLDDVRRFVTKYER